MKIHNLTPNQVTQIYRKYMKNDFPASELKPLAMILQAMESDIYDCLAISDGHKNLLGYAFFTRNGKDYLLDYFATVKELRNNGIGSDILKLLSEYYTNADSVIGEVENPEFATNEADRTLQTRRMNFYLRNGFRLTGVKVILFGVPFLIIETGPNAGHTPDEIRALYRMHYQTILPPESYQKHVRIKEAGEC